MNGEDFFGSDPAGAVAPGTIAASGGSFFGELVGAHVPLGKDFFSDLGEHKLTPGKDFFEVVRERASGPGEDFFLDRVSEPVESIAKDVPPEPEHAKTPVNHDLFLKILLVCVVGGMLVFGGIVLLRHKPSPPAAVVPVDPAIFPEQPQFPPEAELKPQESTPPAVENVVETPKVVPEPPVLSPPTVTPGVNKTYEYFLASAKKYAAKKQWRKAAAEYQKAEASLSAGDVRRVFVLKQQGQMFSKQKAFGKAKNYYLASITTAKRLGVSNPTVTQAYLGIADSFEKMGDLRLASKNFKKALELSKDAGSRKRINSAIRRLSAAVPARTVHVPVKKPAESITPEAKQVDGIVGTWRGTAIESNVEYEVVLRMDSSNAGISEYPTLPCTGTITGGQRSSSVYEFTETITSGRCLNSVITVEITDNEVLSWTATAIVNGKKYSNKAILAKETPTESADEDGGVFITLD